jgi:probable phosphoglycerate mutase
MSHDPLELWLVRHGETIRSAQRQIAGWFNTPLTATGEDQARALRSVLDGHGFDGVWSSDLARAIVTARLAWGEPRQDRRLRELNFGELEGADYHVLRQPEYRKIVDFRDFAAPGGESMPELRARVQDFVGELPAGRHLVFTHGGVIRLLTQDLGVDRFLPTGALAAVDWSHRRLLFVHEPEA